MDNLKNSDIVKQNQERQRQRLNLERLQDLRQLFKDYLIKLNSDNPMRFKAFDLSMVYPEKETVKELLEQVDDLKKLSSFKSSTITKFRACI